MVIAEDGPRTTSVKERTKHLEKGQLGYSIINEYIINESNIETTITTFNDFDIEIMDNINFIYNHKNKIPNSYEKTSMDILLHKIINVKVDDAIIEKLKIIKITLNSMSSYINENKVYDIEELHPQLTNILVKANI